MASKQDLIEIRMKLLGAKEVAEGTGVAKKGIKGVGEATRKTSKESSKAAKANSVLTKSYGALGRAAKYGLGFIGVGGVFALEKAVENTAELSKVTIGLNRNLGLSTKASSRWAAVAHARGIASPALTMGMTKLGKSFVEANRKGGTARTGLNMLGITQAETTKGAHDFNYALGLVANKFGEAAAGPKRQTAAMALLGKGYSTLLPLFSSGNKGLQEQLHWADKYGVTLDGKTNKALMDMVNAQRESKVAMLGLQVSMTKALMPAIDAGEGQLQKFIATLNDPRMSGAEKITAIEGQFEHLENKLIAIITDAVPKVAEQGGTLGWKLGGAVWTGFKNSGLEGKIVVSAWMLKYLGGFGLIGNLGGRVGKKLATSLGWSFLEKVAPYFAAEAGVEGFGPTVARRFEGVRPMFSRWGGRFATALALGFVTLGLSDAKTRASLIHYGSQLGQWVVEGLSTMVNEGIHAINGVLSSLSPLSSLGVSIIPEIPEIDLGGLKGPVPGGLPFGDGTAGGPSGGGGKRNHHPHHPSKGGPKHTPRTAPRHNLAELMNRPIIVQSVLDGKVIAESVTRHANRAAARA
jgi:hypothetical protein